MNVSLPPELTRFVEEKVRSGLFPSHSEVVRLALRLLQERDEMREARLACLREEVAVGLEQARRGELLEGEGVFADLEKRNQSQRDEQP